MMTAKYPPPRFRVLLTGDPFTGRAGIVQRIINDECGLIYVLQFHAEPGDYPPAPNPTGYYRRDELTVT